MASQDGAEVRGSTRVLGGIAMRNLVFALSLSAAACGAAVSSQAQGAHGVPFGWTQAGVLTCALGPATVGSSGLRRDAACSFWPSAGGAAAEVYAAHFDRASGSPGVPGGGIATWRVFAREAVPHDGRLAGVHAGAFADAATVGSEDRVMFGAAGDPLAFVAVDASGEVQTDLGSGTLSLEARPPTLTALHALVSW